MAFIGRVDFSHKRVEIANKRVGSKDQNNGAANN
jgi:hypothetical protein